MAGVVALNEIELGAESTFGTAVTPDIRWRGPGTAPEDLHENTFITESTGNLLGYTENYSAFSEGEMTFEESSANEQHLPHILAAGIKTVAAVADTGGGSGYYYTYPFPTTAQQTPASYTIRGGDDERVIQMKGSVVTSFTITGAARGGIMTGSTWRGHGPTSSSLAGLSFASGLDFFLFQKSKLFIGAVGSYNAATYPAISSQITNTFLGFTLTGTTGQFEKHTGDGSLDASFVKNVGAVYELGITFENNSSTATEYTNFQAGTPRCVSIEVTGAAITGGTLFDFKQLYIDAVGVWTAFPSPSDSEGNNVVEATLSIRDNTTTATAGRVVVVNELSALA